jgi:hypothetical protein
MAQEKELTREQKLELEENAIQALLQMGVKFSVPLKIRPVSPPKFVLWWNKTFPKKAKVWRDSRIPKSWDVAVTEIPDLNIGKLQQTYVRLFHIKPLYLGTIDRLRQLYIQIEYDEEEFQKNPVGESKKMFKYTHLMAQIAAIAVINDPKVADKSNIEVEELTEFFMEHLTVAKLQKMAEVISDMMNPGGFTSSIRSIKEVGLTKPKNRADQIE